MAFFKPSGIDLTKLDCNDKFELYKDLVVAKIDYNIAIERFLYISSKNIEAIATVVTNPSKYTCLCDEYKTFTYSFNIPDKLLPIIKERALIALDRMIDLVEKDTNMACARGYGNRYSPIITNNLIYMKEKIKWDAPDSLDLLIKLYNSDPMMYNAERKPTEKWSDFIDLDETVLIYKSCKLKLDSLLELDFQYAEQKFLKFCSENLKLVWPDFTIEDCKVGKYCPNCFQFQSISVIGVIDEAKKMAIELIDRYNATLTKRKLA